MRVFIGIYFCLFSISAFSQLNIGDRSAELTHEIDSAFDKAKAASYNWYGETETDYGSDLLMSYELVKTIIKASEGKQKYFNIVDVGAGKGGFSDGLAKYIAKQIAEQKLPEDILVRIIGVTAQNNVPYEKIEIDKNCTKYLFGNFNAEHFDANLEKLTQYDLDIKNKIDLATSHLMFLHLIDSVGTLVQVHDNLRPNTGMLYFDYFGVNFARGDDQEFENPWINEILPLTNAQFLIRNHPGEMSQGYFLLRRVEQSKLQFPLRYGPLKTWHPMMSSSWPRDSYILTRQDPIQKLRPFAYPTFDPTTYDLHTKVYGSKNSDDLYQWLVKHSEVFGAKQSQWQSIFVDDDRVLKNNL